MKTKENDVLNGFCDLVASMAVKSLLYEVCVSPKPGLVDRYNNGSHQDMNVFTFIDSATALTPYFREITLEAHKRKTMCPDELLDHLRYLGLLAEAQMYQATSGVNTHKGAIYSLGILCASYGYAFDLSVIPDHKEILGLCGIIARNSSEKQLEEAQKKEIHTNGEKIYLQHKLKGARGEVSEGFPSVVNYALPILEEKIALGWNVNHAGLLALFHLMANIDDTNVIARSDYETQQMVKKRLGEIIREPELTIEKVIAYGNQLDQLFIEQNISSGGAADLLSIAWMLYFMSREKKIAEISSHKV